MMFVRRTFPGHLAENVPLDASIEIIFFVDINKHKISHSQVILFNVTEEKTVPIKFEYASQVLKVKPLNHLDSNSHYQLQLVGGENGLIDITGKIMPESYTLEFYTKSETRVGSTKVISPSNNSEETSSFYIQWEKVEDAYGYVVEVSRENNFHSLEWGGKDSVIYDTSVTPSMDLKKGRYYIRVQAISEKGSVGDWSNVVQIYYAGLDKLVDPYIKGDQDSGEVIVESSTRFQPKEDNGLLSAIRNSLSSIDDRHNLEIISSMPRHKSINIKNLDGNIVKLTFDQEIDPQSATEESIYIIKEY